MSFLKQIRAKYKVVSAQYKKEFSYYFGESGDSSVGDPGWSDSMLVRLEGGIAPEDVANFDKAMKNLIKDQFDVGVLTKEEHDKIIKEEQEAADQYAQEVK